jgi:hypothetical protein
MAKSLIVSAEHGPKNAAEGARIAYGGSGGPQCRQKANALAKKIVAGD